MLSLLLCCVKGVDRGESRAERQGDRTGGRGKDACGREVEGGREREVRVGGREGREVEGGRGGSELLEWEGG